VIIDLTNRDTLMASLPHDGKVVEVGVYHGDFTMEILAFNQPSELFAVDNWDGAAYEPHATEAYTRLGHLAPRIRILRKESLVAAKDFADGSLDIVYLDADHTRCAEDIVAWWPKVRPGGWLTGHDYTMDSGMTVKRDVDEFVARTGLPLLLTRELSHDTYPSWVIQKPLS
jgi:predicted O-methyltransferase YrrM